ncbi:MAG: hypothetical protein QM820_44485 [Minicystis sp.]
MSRLPRAVALLSAAALLLGCRNADERAPTAASAAPSLPKLPSSAKLPVCGTDDPLAALCNLGTDSARFECDKPEPVQFCAKGTEWICRHLQDEPPAVTYRARHDQQGPRVKPGETIDVSQFKREGKVRGVAVQMRVSDGKAAEVRREEIAQKLKEWGCFAQWDPRAKNYDYMCGSWQARIRATSRQVTLEAAESGWMECRP